MSHVSSFNAPVFVPYQHKVSAVARVAGAKLNLDAPLNPYPRQERASSQDAPNAANARGRYSAQAAAPGFAAQILVEAGLTGDDPFAAARGVKAYTKSAANLGYVRLTA
jgi:predicted TIM-barrel fold metal-dependent hydrolase